MSPPSALSVLLEGAAPRHGFVTPETARAAGVDPSRLPVMLARGQLERWGRGLYRIPQLPIGEHAELAAAVLRVGQGAAISHRSALFLYDLDSVQPTPTEVTAPASYRVRRSSLDGVTVWTADLSRDEVVVVDGIRTTTVARTIRDCHAAGVEADVLRRVVADAIAMALLDRRQRSALDALLGGAAPLDNRESVERGRVALIDGKAIYDGRSLVSWASKVADRIVERCGASRVILYGSVARGDDGPDSDIDLLVVMPIVGRRHDTSVRVLNELRDLPVPVDITVVDPAHLDEEASVPGVVRVAMSEGRVLVAA
jgi:predicted nucleotidyltransferase